MSYAFRGVDPEAALDAFDGPRLDPMSGQVVSPMSMGPTIFLGVPGEKTKFGLSRTPSSEILVWCDGPLGYFLEDPRDGLSRGDLLHVGEDGARALAARLGIPIDGCVATVRRCDLASDLEFAQTSDGFAFLRAVGSVVLPRLRTCVTHARGSNAVETVHWKNKAGIQLRIYDKSAQLERSRGRIVRVERQWRPPLRDQVRPSDIASLDLGEIFAHPLRHWTLEGLAVVPLMDAHRVLKSRIGSRLPGKRVLTPVVAERMLGTLCKLLVEGDDGFDSKRQARERRAELRAVGIEVGEQVPAVIDVGSVLSAATRPWKS